MDIIAAYREVGTYRGAAQMCGTTHKTVKRIIERALAADKAPPRRQREHNYDAVAQLVADKVAATHGKISAKRLLPPAQAAGYGGSARNFRRLVAQAKKAWRRDNHRGRRPAVWTPGEMLVIDWGDAGDGLHVFCAVLAWSCFRFVRFADNERAQTTLALLAECFETLGAVPKAVLADRMGCLKGGVVANKVVPTADYVRFATHYAFRPDWCEAADPESKGIVENLVGYAKRDLVVPQAPFEDLTVANIAARAWCAEVNGVAHSEICAIPAERLAAERQVMGALPSLRPVIGKAPLTRKVDKLSCVRFGSARYSVPTRLIGTTVAVAEADGRLLITDLATGEIVAEHAPVAPGEAAVCDEHYGGPRPAPRRAARSAHPGREGVLGAGPGRRDLADRVGRIRQHPAGRRPGRAGRPRCGARGAGAGGRVGACGAVSPVAGRGRALDPGGRSRHPAADRCRGRAGHGPARGPDPVAGRLRPGSARPDGRDRMSAPAVPALPGDLDAALRRLKLAAMRRLAPELLVTARTQRWNPEEFLRTLLEAELTARDASNVRTRMKAAAFPVIKTIEEFDVAGSCIPRATFDYLASLEWIRASENYCAVGPAGTGKSHSLVAFGVAAVHAGHKVRYFTAAELVETLYRGLADNSVGRVIENLLRNDLVIIDEVGFAPLDDTGAQLLFRFVAAAYERRALGIGSHWPFDQWGRFLPEHTTAVSLLDRLLHHSVVVVTEGESFRMKQARTRTGGRLAKR